MTLCRAYCNRTVGSPRECYKNDAIFLTFLSNWPSGFHPLHFKSLVISCLGGQYGTQYATGAIEPMSLLLNSVI